MDDEAKKARAEYLREYRKKNKDRLNEYQRQWRKENPDKVIEYYTRYWNNKTKALKKERGRANE